MRVSRFSHAADFMDVAADALYQNEALNCLMIGVVDRLVDTPDFYGGDEAYLGLVSRDGEIILAGSMTPPFGLLLVPLGAQSGTFQPDEVRFGMALMVQGLKRESIFPPDVHAVTPHARQFAELWAATSGGSYRHLMDQRIYTLERVKHPTGVTGTFVQAGQEHADLITLWMQAFEIEALQESPRDAGKLFQSVSRRIEAGDWFLWQDAGETVSMCLRTRPTRSGCSVSGVYTPPEKRRRGYASACVAALSQKLLDDGYSFTSLFTDLANPTSNQIYRNIGYQPLADFEKYKLVRQANR